MNVTLSIDERLVKRAREAARKRGTSLNDLIREYLRTLTGDNDREAAIRELQRLWDLSSGRSASKIRREDAYEERLSRMSPRK